MEGERDTDGDTDSDTLFCRTTGGGDSDADLERVLFFVFVRALCTGGGGGDSDTDLSFIVRLLLRPGGSNRCFLAATVTFLGGDTEESDDEACLCFRERATGGGSGELESEL